MSEETDYKKLFKPFCIDFKCDDEIESKAKVKFIFDNKEDAFELFRGFYDEVYGTININENLVSIHTGGWSENEAIIYEFKKTFWWTSNFRMQSAGGHYYFDTDKMKGKKEWDIVIKEI